MSFHKVLIVPLSAAALVLTGCTHVIQQVTLLSKMRAQYYDMRAAGAKGFYCKAQPNWPLFVTSANHYPAGQALADTPWHRYLQGVTLTLHASLDGGTTVTWDEKTPPPPDKAAIAKQLETAFRTMLDGFMTALRPSLKNTLLPAIPLSEIRTTPGGYTLTERDAQGRTSDVTLDKSYQVTHVSVRGPNTNVDSDMKFIRSPKGFLLIEMDSSIPKADGTDGHSVMKTSYAEVDGFEVPNTFEVDTASTQVHMDFTDCRVER